MPLKSNQNLCEPSIEPLNSEKTFSHSEADDKSRTYSRLAQIYKEKGKSRKFRENEKGGLKTARAAILLQINL